MEVLLTAGGRWWVPDGKDSDKLMALLSEVAKPLNLTATSECSQLKSKDSRLEHQRESVKDLSVTQLVTRAKSAVRQGLKQRAEVCQAELARRTRQDKPADEGDDKAPEVRDTGVSAGARGSSGVSAKAKLKSVGSTRRGKKKSSRST